MSDDVTFTTMPSLGLEASASVVTSMPGRTRKPDGTVTPGPTRASGETIAPGSIVASSMTARAPIPVGWAALRVGADRAGPQDLRPVADRDVVADQQRGRRYAWPGFATSGALSSTSEPSPILIAHRPRPSRVA